MYWLLIISIALISYPASASAADGRLAGVTVIDFVIEPLDQDDASCGITNDLIDRAVMHPISGSQLRLNRDRKDLKNPYLNVNITSLFSKNAGFYERSRRCASKRRKQLCWSRSFCGPAGNCSWAHPVRTVSKCK